MLYTAISVNCTSAWYELNSENYPVPKYKYETETRQYVTYITYDEILNAEGQQVSS